MILRNVSVLLLFAAAVPIAQADSYVSGHVGSGRQIETEVTDGPVTVDLGFDETTAVSVALGAVFGNTRGEVEISHQENDIDRIGLTGLAVNPADVGFTGSIKSRTLLFNGYYDFVTGNNFRPYVSAGIGFSDVGVIADVEGVPEVSARGNNTVLSYQVGLGVGYALTENTTLDLRYRYFTNDDVNFQEREMRHHSHNFMGGLRVNF